MKTNNLTAKFLKRLIQVSVLILLFANALYAQERITLLYWNDFHSQNIPFLSNPRDSSSALVGGYATLMGYITSIREETQNVALIHAGDEFQGTPICTITKGRSQIELLNMILPDAMTLGNHEFDYGKETLLELMSDAKFPIISANLFDKTRGKLFARPYLIKKFGEIRVGFIGLMTPALPHLTLPKHVHGLKILPPKAVVKKYVTSIKDSTDLIVLVSHTGFKEDKQLAEAISDVHVIIGGHSHTKLSRPIKVNGILICQAGSRGRYLGRLDLWVDTQKKKILKYQSKLIETIVGKVPSDTRIQAKVDELEQVVEADLGQVIGILKTPWVRKRRAESNIGNWQTDVMRQFAGTDIALQNAGGIRKDLYARKITIRDLWEMNPFSNHFVVFTLTGAELRRVIEKNCNNRGEFFQVSGVKYKYNPKRPAGNRVLEIQVAGQPLNDKKTYSVCTNNYVVDNFYYAFGISPRGKTFKHLEQLDRDVFIEAVKRQKVIDSKVEGRIIAVKE